MIQGRLTVSIEILAPTARTLSSNWTVVCVVHTGGISHQIWTVEIVDSSIGLFHVPVLAITAKTSFHTSHKGSRLQISISLLGLSDNVIVDEDRDSHEKRKGKKGQLLLTAYLSSPINNLNPWLQNPITIAKDL